jgi:hypothetical protein
MSESGENPVIWGMSDQCLVCSKADIAWAIYEYTS